MALKTRTSDLKLVSEAAGLELDALAIEGLWTEEQYLRLSDQTNHLIEITDGTIEVLPMPTLRHQVLLFLFYRLLYESVELAGGKVVGAPFRLQVRADSFREPDLLLLLDADDRRSQDSYWLGADLVLEVVSPEKPERDTVEKVRDYAEAGIPEYWIVNPLDETITVLTLRGDSYAEHGVFRRGDRARSALLTDFGVSVDEVFGAR